MKNHYEINQRQWALKFKNGYTVKPQEKTTTSVLLCFLFYVVPAKQCRLIISIGYISWLLAAHGEKSGVCKAREGDISKPALLCRDYPCASTPENVNLFLSEPLERFVLY